MNCSLNASSCESSFRSILDLRVEKSILKALCYVNPPGQGAREPPVVGWVIGALHLKSLHCPFIVVQYHCVSILWSPLEGSLISDSDSEMTSCIPFGLHAGDTDCGTDCCYVCYAFLDSKAELMMMVKYVEAPWSTNYLEVTM